MNASDDFIRDPITLTETCALTKMTMRWLKVWSTDQPMPLAFPHESGSECAVLELLHERQRIVNQLEDLGVQQQQQQKDAQVLLWPPTMFTLQDTKHHLESRGQQRNFNCVFFQEGLHCGFDLGAERGWLKFRDFDDVSLPFPVKFSADGTKVLAVVALESIKNDFVDAFAYVECEYPVGCEDDSEVEYHKDYSLVLMRWREPPPNITSFAAVVDTEEAQDKKRHPTPVMTTHDNKGSKRVKTSVVTNEASACLYSED